MSLDISQKVKIRVSIQIVSVGVILGLIYVSFSNGFSELHPFITGGAAGFLLGLIISFLELWIFTGGSRKMRFIVLLGLRTGIYITLITATIFLVTIFSRVLRFEMSFDQVLASREFQDYLLRGNFGIAVLYSLLFAFSINFTRMISRKMGQGMLISFITGTFYKPVKQDRIIMFLGISNINRFSKTLSEFEFFNFLNEFFFDITSPIVQHEGIIYEYVEDQVVISWRPEKGLRNANCIRTFFKIREKLETLKEHYYNKYKSIPKILAALHYGTLVRAEIGKIKTQIVFHGDAMNTTARIQSKCKELEEQFLISKEISERIEMPVLYRSRKVGNFRMKGKQADVSLVAIDDKKLNTL